VWRIAPTGASATASVAGSVSIWHAIATPRMLGDNLTTNVTRKQWREWISPTLNTSSCTPWLPDPLD
jgi:hypothetical protein